MRAGRRQGLPGYRSRGASALMCATLAFSLGAGSAVRAQVTPAPVTPAPVTPAPVTPPHATPPEPSDYRLDAFRTPTPATLKGARVLDTDAAEEVWKSGAAAFIDVLPRPPRPAGLPAGTLWRDQPHSSIPGAIWLANVGFGALNPDADAYFRAGLSAASRGDVNAPLVIFCQRECWMSWNAAKRALAYGYRNVSWFPEGTDGWADAGLPLVPVEPRP